MLNQTPTSYPQNPVDFGNGFGESGKSPLFPSKSKAAFPKLQFWESL
jgi:hypothetical protein